MASDATNALDGLLKTYQSALDADNLHLADNAARQILAGATKTGAIDNSPVSKFTRIAKQSQDTADWNGAEDAYSKILLLPDLDAVSQFQAHRNLADLYSMLNRGGDALRHCRSAVVALEGGEYPGILAVALADCAYSAIKVGFFAEAFECVAKAFELVSRDSAAGQIEARILTLRAACCIHRGDLDEAAIDLERSHRLLHPRLAMKMAAGVHADMARWWTVIALFRSTQKRTSDAIQAWENAASIRRNVASLPHVDRISGCMGIARALKGLAEALAQAGRMEDSAAIVEERRSMLREIGVPPDADT